jgi:RNA polymerase sigma-70 factor (ECF subfamily)
VIDAVYRAESRCVLATLIRLLGAFELAVEARHEAFAAAVEQWPRSVHQFARPRDGARVARIASASSIVAIEGRRRPQRARQHVDVAHHGRFQEPLEVHVVGHVGPGT